MFAKAVFALGLLAAVPSLGQADNSNHDSATYELRRINVADNGDYQSRCHFSPGVVHHITQLGQIQSEQDLPLVVDDSLIQQLVDEAPGVTPPSFDNLNKAYTNWWVRSSPTAPWKLIRSNTTNNPGGVLLQDQSYAAQTLAVFMGINCPRTFGQ